MEFRREDSPRGVRLLVNGRSLYSTYAPEKEAATWVATLQLSENATLFLAGDLQGHLARALLSSWPHLRIVHLLPCDQTTTSHEAIWCWYPGQEPLEFFLERILGLTGPADCHWQVWPALERAAPEETLAWATTFRDIYRTVQGSWLTRKFSGKRWWQNSLRNAVDWERPRFPRAGSKPIVVAASGPSLGDGWDQLRLYRKDFELWALPSSFEALRLRGLEPDVAVTTDGGFYAKEHLQRLSGGSAVVLSALSGCSDPVLSLSPSLLFSQGLPWESRLLSRFSGTPAQVPSQGTVAVTALQWALALTTGPVLVAGLDLAFFDYRGHVSGHTVDRRLALEVGRTSPWETMWAQRCFAQATVSLGGGQRTSPAMRTYALWLGSKTRFGRQVFRLAPTALSWQGMIACEWDQLGPLVRGGREEAGVSWHLPPGSWPDRAQRRRLVRQTLELWRTELRRGEFSAVTLRSWAATLTPEALQEHLTQAKDPVDPKISDLSGVLGDFLDQLELC